MVDVDAVVDDGGIIRAFLLPYGLSRARPSFLTRGSSGAGCHQVEKHSDVDILIISLSWSITYYIASSFKTSFINLSFFNFRASIERLADNGAYLVENGISLFLYIGLQVDAGWIKDIFDVDSLQQVLKPLILYGLRLSGCQNW